MKNRYEVANRLNLNIHMGEFVVLDPRWKQERVCDSFTRLYFIQSGSGYLRAGGQTVQMKPGMVYMIPSRLEFAYGCTQLTKLYFHVTLTGIEGLDLLSGVGGIRCVPFSPEEFDQLAKFSGEDYGQLIRLKALLYQVIMRCRDSGPVGPSPVRRYSELVTRAIQYIQGELSMQLSAGDIAGALYASESRLRNSFRAEMGLPVGKYINDLLAIRARQMLICSSEPISQISRSLGFSDQFYFSRWFRNKFHQSPSQFRRDHPGGV